MLKGINRRIIEINRTNNDYFEKAILFVKSDKIGCSQQLLSSQADLFLKELPVNQKNSSGKARAIICSIILLLFGIFAFYLLYSVL